MRFDVEHARKLAEELLAVPLPRRWAHSAGVAAKARSLDGHVSDVRLLEAAAWLHDVGYSPALVQTGFHPLDGARHLRVLGAPELLARLVAHHSCAAVEAEERGLGNELEAEFPLPDEELLNALTACDMTTTPNGESVAARDRILEILARYDASDPVHRAITKSQETLIAVAEAAFPPRASSS